MKIIFAIFITMQFSWALGDRALFSTGKRVFFVGNANKIIRVFKNGFCKSKLPLTNTILKFNQPDLILSKSLGDLNPEEVLATTSIIKFEKLANMANKVKISKSERRQVSSCAIGERASVLRSSKGLVTRLIKVEKYLQDRLGGSGKKQSQVLKSLDSLINNFVNKVNHREFF